MHCVQNARRPVGAARRSCGDRVRRRHLLVDAQDCVSRVFRSGPTKFLFGLSSVHNAREILRKQFITYTHRVKECISGARVCLAVRRLERTPIDTRLRPLLFPLCAHRGCAPVA